jgi:hypothetical protein
LADAAESAQKNGCRLVIFYHPQVLVNDEGRPYTGDVSMYSDLMNDLCNQHGILYADMTDIFLSAYEDSYILPYGFANTTPGSGHLNEYGHRMIAEELGRIISEDMKK